MSSNTPIKINCPICNVSFPSIDLFQIHISENHKICPICRKIFSTLDEFEEHFKKEHYDKDEHRELVDCTYHDSIKCRVCEKVLVHISEFSGRYKTDFEKIDWMREHYQNKHRFCPICDSDWY